MQKLLKWIDQPEKLSNTLLNIDHDKRLKILTEQDHHGDSLVHFAARAHNKPVLALLHQLGADLEAVNEHGRRPLHEAIDHLGCVDYLVHTCHVNVNAMKRGDWTPVMIAAMKGRLDLVQLLTDAGALLNRQTKDGRTALYLAVQEGHLDVVSYLADKEPSAITVATRSGRYPTQAAAAYTASKDVAFAMTTCLLSSDAMLPSLLLLLHRDHAGRNILLDAAAAQNLRLVTYLLDRGADAKDTDALGRNMVHHAAMMGHLDILKALRSIPDLDWNQQDTWDHWTPLMHASKEGHVDCVKYLMDFVDLSIQDKQGRTAQDLALLWNRQTVLCLFSK